MPAVRRAVTTADAANVSVISTGFTGNLSAADDDAQKIFDKLDQLVLGGADVADWVTSTTYQVGDVVRFQGMPFFATQTHASAASFATDLNKWKPFYGFAQVVNQAAHGFTRWKPIYGSGTNWAAANSNVAETLATHVVLEASTDWFLAVNQGTYTYVAHGLGTGVKYLTGVNLSASPSNYENAVLDCKDADRVEVLSYLPAIFRKESETLISDFELIGRVSITGGAVNQTLSWSKAYTWLKVVSVIRSTSDSKYLLARLNGDSSANYPHVYLQAYNTTVQSAANATATGINLGFTYYGGSAVNNSSAAEALIHIKNTGVQRAWNLHGGYLSSALARVTINRSGHWTNTADTVTSITIVYDDGITSATFCDVLVYGKV